MTDGGEGYVGTVCEVGKAGSSSSPEKTVVVQWDSGFRTNYRVGYQGQFDLRVIDNAQIGKFFFIFSVVVKVLFSRVVRGSLLTRTCSFFYKKYF